MAKSVQGTTSCISAPRCTICNKTHRRSEKIAQSMLPYKSRSSTHRRLRNTASSNITPSGLGFRNKLKLGRLLVLEFQLYIHVGEYAENTLGIAFFYKNYRLAKVRRSIQLDKRDVGGKYTTNSSQHGRSFT
ncbi:uncharacterized protein PHALS_01126 [Plasmopara halstedii]|uniref:Uncharacterized protein n=1 Tax=Plasmopara halstedii TaxID=4781 RepID=A0A0P1AS91_PLAHL|nr:uncharacterized protein PHALS_01126 [Plasmopara halstedii]CEG44789.1 hypothetical protein PHALS_01126 [Plasmopara halstedii]|eukprot:XP_024581158.1 hypothetical protein PHALS_01126 [Plasmopara halstedii]